MYTTTDSQMFSRLTMQMIQHIINVVANNYKQLISVAAICATNSHTAPVVRTALAPLVCLVVVINYWIDVHEHQ